MTYETVLEIIAPRENRWLPRAPTSVGSMGEIFNYAPELALEETFLSGEDLLSRLVGPRVFVSHLATDLVLTTVSDPVVLLEPVGATTVVPGIKTVQSVAPPFDQLSPMVASALTARWQAPCEGAFEFLAEAFPHELIRLISAVDLDSVDLSFAAESLGRTADSEVVRQTLIPLLDHRDAMVREGAIYGLRGHENEETHARLTRLAASDPSWEVRQVASDALAAS